MSEINTELLSAESKGRKHIPVAVFAVVVVHLVLFLVLLIAAGCRSSARAKAKNQPEPAAPTQQKSPADQYAHAAATNSTPAGPVAFSEPVMATEPVVDETPSERVTVAQTSQPAARRQAPAREAQTVSRPTVQKVALREYVVQSGDTVGEIAKRHGTTVEAIKSANKLKGHMIRPGQKLVVRPNPSEASTAQAKAARAKTSNEV